MLDKRMMLGVVVTQIVPQMMQFKKFYHHQIEVNPLSYSNLRSVQPTFRHLIDFITVQHQVGCESVMLIKKYVLVLNSKGVFVTDAPNGFENVRAVLAEYVHRAEKKQQDMTEQTEHEKCLTNGTYERARESGTEQNYDMIDGCVNNVPKKPRRIGGRWSVLDRLHIKQAERKQKEQTQQQQQERSRRN